MKTQAEIDAANQYKSYRKGWVEGARTTAMDPLAAQHENVLIRNAYNLGYKHGQVARDEAGRFASDKYGYEPQILRLCEDGHAPAD